MSTVWIFAYGSLIWRPGFAYERRVRGFIAGYERRFWQGSTDHRGTPERPGRVVTLVPTPGARCFGVAYELVGEHAEAICHELDARESGGYQRLNVDFMPERRSDPKQRVMAYYADERNPHFLGDAPLSQIASQVLHASGRSGHNVEYVLRLAESLDELGTPDPHVFDLANLLSDPEAADD